MPDIMGLLLYNYDVNCYPYFIWDIQKFKHIYEGKLVFKGHKRSHFVYYKNFIILFIVRLDSGTSELKSFNIKTNKYEILFKLQFDSDINNYELITNSYFTEILLLKTSI